MRRGDIAEYKGRKYRVLYAGPTRYGDRANLEFMDGSKSFWVDLSLVRPSRGGGGGGYSYDRRPSRKKEKVRYWDGRTEWLDPEDAAMVEDMGRGVIE